MYRDDYFITEVKQRGRKWKERGRRRGQMEREGGGGGENWMLGWSWLMVSTEERGIKKVEKDKKDKNRWRGEKRDGCMDGQTGSERDGGDDVGAWDWSVPVAGLLSYRQLLLVITSLEQTKHQFFLRGKARDELQPRLSRRSSQWRLWKWPAATCTAAGDDLSSLRWPRVLLSTNTTVKDSEFLQFAALVAFLLNKRKNSV